MNVVSQEFLLFLCSFLTFLFSFCLVFHVFLSIGSIWTLFTEEKKKFWFSFKKTFLFYIYVSYFCIFFYSYLLHIVVYITLVWIDTIIYFSMKNTLETNKNPKMWFWEMKFVLTKNRKKNKWIKMYSVNLTFVLSWVNKGNKTGMKWELETVTCASVVIKLLNSVTLNAWVVAVLMKDLVTKSLILPFFISRSQICIVPPPLLLFCANFVISIVLLKAA